MKQSATQPLLLSGTIRTVTPQGCGSGQSFDVFPLGVPPCVPETTCVSADVVLAVVERAAAIFDAAGNRYVYQAQVRSFSSYLPALVWPRLTRRCAVPTRLAAPAHDAWPVCATIAAASRACIVPVSRLGVWPACQVSAPTWRE